MRLLDLFCGAGGAAMGYYQAGFAEIVGVDIVPQPNYPFEFVQGDALDVVTELNMEIHPEEARRWPLGEFDLIHASPPCQASSTMNNRAKVEGWDIGWGDLIPETRLMLDLLGVPYVIENVLGSDLRRDVTLAGEMFNLPTTRARAFELGGWFSMSMPKVPRRVGSVAVYGKPDGRRLWTRSDGSELRAWSNLEEGKQALGVPWMQTELEVREAIPPAYTKFIGEQFLALTKEEK